MLYGIHLRNSHLYLRRLAATPLFHVLLNSCKFLFREFPFESTKSIVLCQGLVMVSSAGIGIAAFKAFTSDHKPAKYS